MGFILLFAAVVAADLRELKKHHHHHHHHHHKHHDEAATSAPAAGDASHALVTSASSASSASTAQAAKDVNSTETEIMAKMKELEAKMDVNEAEGEAGVKTGHLIVNGPLPTDFSAKFKEAVASATGCDPNAVHVIDSQAAVAFIQIQKASLKEHTTVQITFTAPAEVVDAVEEQAADADSKLVNGELHDFLVAPDDAPAAPAAAAPAAAASPVDVDTEMPYGELEPFGREDTAQELTDHSVQESDEMVDQLERAEVAEEKRAVFRALTRLRGAAITSYDGIARAQTGNIDEYNHLHKWRETHPLHHLADEESDVSKWAFPDNAD
jgi:hypothetical protein